MDITTTKITALAPAFGMPTYGPASRAAQRALVCAGTTFEMGATHVAGIADVRVKGAFPGDVAWSPPTC